MKTTVLVRLVAECDVEIVVEHEYDESPTCLTDGEKEAAALKGEPCPVWKFDSARVVKP